MTIQVSPHPKTHQIIAAATKTPATSPHVARMRHTIRRNDSSLSGGARQYLGLVKRTRIDEDMAIPWDGDGTASDDYSDGYVDGIIDGSMVCKNNVTKIFYVREEQYEWPYSLCPINIHPAD